MLACRSLPCFSSSLGKEHLQLRALLMLTHTMGDTYTTLSLFCLLCAPCEQHYQKAVPINIYPCTYRALPVLRQLPALMQEGTHTCRNRNPCYNPSIASLTENGQAHVFQTSSASKKETFIPGGPLSSCVPGRKESILRDDRNQTQETPHCRGDFSEAFISLLTLGLQEAAAH